MREIKKTKKEIKELINTTYKIVYVVVATKKIINEAGYELSEDYREFGAFAQENGIPPTFTNYQNWLRKDKNKSRDYPLAAFSTRELAEEYISIDGNLPFDFHEEDCSIEVLEDAIKIKEWKVDYQIYFEEWNKLEAK